MEVHAELFPRSGSSRFLLFSLVPLVWAQNSTHGIAQRATLKTSSVAQLVIRQIKILGAKDSIEIEVNSSDPINPQTQVLTAPIAC